MRSPRIPSRPVAVRAPAAASASVLRALLLLLCACALSSLLGLVLDLSPGPAFVDAQAVPDPAFPFLLPPDQSAALTDLFHALGGQHWRDLTLWNDPIASPCRHGVSCELDFSTFPPTHAFVTKLLLSGNSLSGAMPNASVWQRLPLTVIDLSSNQISGSMADVLSVGPSLQKLTLSNNPLSGPLPTVEWLHVPFLQELTITHTQLSGPLPVELSSLAFLNQLDLSSNRLSGPLPPEYGALTSLEGVVLADNDLSGNLPPEWGTMPLKMFMCNGNRRLGGPFPDEWSAHSFFILNLSGCSFNGTIPAWFQHMFAIGIFLSDNQFSGSPFPALCNPIFGEIRIDNNRLSGPIDPCFGLMIPGLFTFTASNNQLEGDLPPLINLPSLSTIDLSNNRLTASSGRLPSTMDQLEKLQSLNLRDNPLGLSLDGVQGVVNSGGIEPLSRLKDLNRLDLTNTSTRGDMAMLTLNSPSGADAQVWKSLTNLQLGSNQLTGKASGGGVLALLPYLTYVDLSRNNLSGDVSDLGHVTTLLVTDNPLLRWDGSMPPGIEINSAAGFILTDATMPGAQCPQFGHATRNVIFRVDPSYHDNTLCQCQHGWFGAPPACQRVPNSVVSNSAAAALESLGANGGRSDKVRALSDADYGHQRQLTGMELAYTIDAYANGSNAGVAGVRPAGSPPVLSIYITLALNRDLFVDFHNLISIYQGDASLSGTRFAQIRGIDSSMSTIVSCPETDANSETHTPPGQLQQQVAVVFGPQAVIYFSSRDAGGHHFDASFAFSTECPPGYWPTHTDTYCELIPPTFVPNADLQLTVYVVNAFVLFVLVVLALVVLVYRESAVIRSSSSLFNLVVLLGLIVMSVAGITWALEPNSAVCHARGWLTPFSMMIALGAVAVKSDRIRQIFGTRKLQKLVLTNAMLLRTLALMALPQLVLCIVYSAAPMVTPVFERGPGSLDDRLVNQCLTASGFQIWYAVQLAILSLLLLFALFNAFATRNAPSAFNEASWIGASVYLFALFMLLGLPLQVLVSNHPDTLAVLNGLGMGIAALSLAGLLFGSKCWTIVQLSSRSGAQATQMASQVTQADTRLTTVNAKQIQLNANTKHQTRVAPMPARSAAATSPAAAYRIGRVDPPPSAASHASGDAPAVSFMAASPAASQFSEPVAQEEQLQVRIQGQPIMGGELLGEATLPAAPTPMDDDADASAPLPAQLPNCVQ